MNRKLTLNDLYEFREESLAELTKEDRKHLLHTGYKINSILDKVSKQDYNYVFDMLDKLSDEYLSYCSYYNKKNYIAGFKDAINLIIDCGGANNEVT